MSDYKIYFGNLIIIWIVFLFTAVEEFVTKGGWLIFILNYIWLPVLPILFIFLDTKLSKVKKVKWETFSVNRVSILILVALIFISLPWLFSIVYVDISKVPVLNYIFLFPNHTGLHHGYNGWFTLVSAILLLPAIKESRNGTIKKIAWVLILILFFIGFQNLVDDLAVEQLEPRFGIKSPFGIFHR